MFAATPQPVRMTVSVLLFAWYLYDRSADTGCCKGFLSNLCGINGRAAVCLARSAVPVRGGVCSVALVSPVDGDNDFVGFGESGAHRARAHRTAERFRGGRAVGQGGARRVLGAGLGLGRRPAAVPMARRSRRRRVDDAGLVRFGRRRDRLRRGRRLGRDARSVATRRMRPVDGVGRAHHRNRRIRRGAPD